MKVRPARRKEQGSVLILTIVFLALFGTVVGLMLSFGQVGMKLHNAEASKSHLLYAADGGIQYATNATKANSGVCPTAMTGAGQNLAGTMSLPSDVANVNVKCQQYTGAGTNSFAGYAVVAGVNLGTTPSSFAPNAQSNCISISSDPVGSGLPTFASGTRSCQKFPTGGAPPSWTQFITPNPANQGTLDASASVNGTFVLSPTEQWFVGTRVVGGVTQPFVWFAPDLDDIADATGAGGSPLPNTFAPTKVWAAGPGQVFVAGTQAGAGAVYLSSDSENAATAGGLVHWNQMTLPAGVKSLTDIYGLPGDPGHVWAVGLNTANVGSVWFFDGATWTLATALFNSTAATGVWAADASNVWVSGTSAGSGAIWANANWATNVSLVGTTITLNDVRGYDAQHVWAVGVSTGTARGAISVFNAAGNTWPAAANFAGTVKFTTVVPADSSHVWVFGAATNTTATVWFNCTGLAGCPGSGWRNTIEGQLPATTPPALNDASGIPVVNTTGITYVVTTVGGGGTGLAWAPLAAASPNNCTTSSWCLAQVQGNVYNANGTNLVSGMCLSLPTGSPCTQVGPTFTQWRGAGASCPARPNVGPAAAPYACTAQAAAMPAFPQYPLPTTKPAAAPSQQGTFVAGTGACAAGGGYHYFTPGTYTQEINFTPHSTYFFESGVYVIEGNSSATGGFGAFDNLTSPPAPNELWVIGGKPSPGDVPAYAQTSPCWAAIQANSAVWNGGSGTGINLIMAKSTWLDVHTVNLELFTRAGGNVATEGPQGLSIRDVSGISSGSSPWGSDINNRPAPNMVLQVDANSPLHYPNVYVHGGIFLPNENVEEYTNPQPGAHGPVLGPIFANSIEFSFSSALQPPLIVAPGSTDNPTAVFTATSGQVTIQAFVPFDASTTPPTVQLDPAKGYSWRVVSPS